jgi:hypothetical protein
MSSALDRLLSTLGRTGVLAIGLAIFAAVIYGSHVAPARSQLAALQARAAQLHAQQPTSTAKTAAENPLARIDAYYGSFPGVDELAFAIADTLALAKQYNLAIDQAEYNTESARKDELMVYQMSFALKGPYPKIRGFLMTLLKNNPALSLDDVSLKRDGIASAEIEAKVRVTFYLTSLPWNRPTAAAG